MFILCNKNRQRATRRAVDLISWACPCGRKVVVNSTWRFGVREAHAMPSIRQPRAVSAQWITCRSHRLLQGVSDEKIDSRGRLVPGA